MYDNGDISEDSCRKHSCNAFDGSTLIRRVGIQLAFSEAGEDLTEEHSG